MSVEEPSRPQVMEELFLKQKGRQWELAGLVMYTEGGLCWEKKEEQGKPREEEKEENVSGRKRKFSIPSSFETNPAYMLSLSRQFYFLFFPFPFALQRQGKKKEGEKEE